MEYLYNLIESGTVPALTAILLGLMTAISPCPMGTNIVAIGYISRDLESKNKIFLRGLLYTLGRIIGYTTLGIVLIMIIKEGTSMFGIQKFFTKYGELFIGPILIIVGIFMLIGDKIKLPSINISSDKIKVTGNTSINIPSINTRDIILINLLSHQRTLLFRNADSDVGNGNSRISFPRVICYCHSITRDYNCLDISLQRAKNRYCIRPN